MAKHMRVNLTGQGFLSDEVDARTCPVCGYGDLSYEPKSMEDFCYDSYGAFYVGTNCPKCGSRLSASFDFHDVEVDLDARFGEEQ